MVIEATAIELPLLVASLPASAWASASELTVISSEGSLNQNFVFSWEEESGGKEKKSNLKKGVNPDDSCQQKIKKLKKKSLKKKEKERTWTTVANIVTFLSFASDGAVHLGFGLFLAPLCGDSYRQFVQG